MLVLNNYGFNNHFANAFTSYLNTGLFPARVVRIQGYKFYIITEEAELEAEVTGSLLSTKEEWELPKVGDWVVYTAIEGRGYITAVLERQSELSRKMPGKRVEKQVLAANVDPAMVVLAIDKDFNLMRLQRYLYQILQNQIEVIVLLNKCDLVKHPEDFQQQVADLGYHVKVLPISLVSHLGLKDLEENAMEPGKTYVLLGQSGAGKSSLFNYLAGNEAHSTSEMSASNHKGKHTTTFRELSLLPNGSLLIDTPGTREFGITADEAEDPLLIHPVIARLSSLCRFPDCRHESEPGCAVKQAILTGELSELAYRSYLKLTKEQQHFSAAVSDKKRREKQHGKIARQIQVFKRKTKF